MEIRPQLQILDGRVVRIDGNFEAGDGRVVRIDGNLKLGTAELQLTARLKLGAI